MKKSLILSALLATLAYFPAMAAPSDPEVQVEMMPGWRQADGTHMAALRLTLADNWKTYWRAPGDAGIPPSFDWSGSRNLLSVEPQWPTPKVFMQNGMRSIGYKHELILPLKLVPKNVDAPIDLQVQMMVGVCEDICLPVDLTIQSTLPVSHMPDSIILDALSTQPGNGDEAELSCTLSPTADGLRLVAKLNRKSARNISAIAVETSDPEVWVAQETVKEAGGKLLVETELLHVDGGAFALDRSGLRFTVLGAGPAVEYKGCPAG